MGLVLNRLCNGRGSVDVSQTTSVMQGQQTYEHIALFGIRETTNESETCRPFVFW